MLSSLSSGILTATDLAAVPGLRTGPVVGR